MITADSGYMRLTRDETGLIMTLYNGNGFTETEEKNVNIAARKYHSRKDNFKEQSIVISLTGFDLQRSEDGLFKSGPAMLNISQLTFTIDSLNKKHIEKLNTQFKDFKNLKLYVVRNVRSNYPNETGMPASFKKIIKFNTKSLYD